MEPSPAQNPGVIYLSTVPRFMQAHKLRHLLSAYGEVGRIYLMPEDESSHASRVKTGGCKKTLFKEGWVEFLDKRVAKTVAASLNGTSLGGPKRHNFYREDIWCLKYLSGFTWDALTSYKAHVGQLKSQSLKSAIATQKSENKKTSKALIHKKYLLKRLKKRSAAGETKADKAEVSVQPREDHRVLADS